MRFRRELEIGLFLGLIAAAASSGRLALAQSADERARLEADSKGRSCARDGSLGVEFLGFDFPGSQPNLSRRRDYDDLATGFCPRCCGQVYQNHSTESFSVCVDSCAVEGVDISINNTRRPRVPVGRYPAASPPAYAAPAPARVTAQGCAGSALSQFDFEIESRRAKGMKAFKKLGLPDDETLSGYCAPCCNLVGGDCLGACLQAVAGRRDALSDALFPPPADLATEACDPIGDTLQCCDARRITSRNVWTRLDEPVPEGKVYLGWYGESCEKVVQGKACRTSKIKRGRQWKCWKRDPSAMKGIAGCRPRPAKNGVTEKRCCPIEVEQSDFIVEDNVTDPAVPLKWRQGWAQSCVDGWVLGKKPDQPVPGVPIFESDCNLDYGGTGTLWGCRKVEGNFRIPTRAVSTPSGSGGRTPAEGGAGN